MATVGGGDIHDRGDEEDDDNVQDGVDGDNEGNGGDGGENKGGVDCTMFLSNALNSFSYLCRPVFVFIYIIVDILRKIVD